MINLDGIPKLNQNEINFALWKRCEFQKDINRKKLIKKPKFNPGCFVYISEDVPYFMSHFRKGVPAMIYENVSEYKSTEDEYVTNYSLVVRHEDSKWSSSSWYPEGVLTEITDQKKINEYIKEMLDEATQAD